MTASSGPTAAEFDTLGASPRLYPHHLSPGADAYRFIPMRREDYRQASFLDERLPAHDAAAPWISRSRVAAALAASLHARPLHFLFHIGHTGSTLLSRLLDDTGQVLGLREPLPLRSLAGLYDPDPVAPATVDRQAVDAALDTSLALWSRGFADTACVVVKATSAAGRIHPQILAARPEVRIVYLGQGAATHLEVLLAGANSAADLSAFAPERSARLVRSLGAPVPAARSLGELAAMSWLSEMLTRQAAAGTHGAQTVLQVDFEAFLRSPQAGLDAVLRHLGLAVSPAQLDAIVQGPTMRVYSKATAHAYDMQTRQQILARSRIENALQIRAGLRWLERLAASQEPVAAVLGA